VYVLARYGFNCVTRILCAYIYLFYVRVRHFLSSFAVFADIYSMPWNGFYSFRWLSPGKGRPNLFYNCTRPGRLHILTILRARFCLAFLTSKSMSSGRCPTYTLGTRASASIESIEIRFFRALIMQIFVFAMCILHNYEIIMFHRGSQNGGTHILMVFLIIFSIFSGF
jgi:hypothetical protein